MRSWHEPTAAEVTGALARLGQPQQRAYFFDRLDNPMWVNPLSAAQAFAAPPEPVPADEPGYVSYPPWPEGDYLKRIAGDAPAGVADALSRITGNDNPIVARTLLEAAAALPDSHLPDVLPAATNWLRTPNADWYADAAITLIVRALALGRKKQALKLAGSLLAIQTDPRIEEKRARNDGVGFSPSLEPVARLTDWEYNRAVEQLVRDGANIAGTDLVKLLSRLLHQALGRSEWNYDERDASEYSYIWRPAIESHAQNHDSDVRDALVGGLRDATIAVTTAQPDTFDELVGVLLAGSTLHQRIGLYVLSTSVQGIETVARYLRNTEFLDDYRFTHEIAQLLDGRWNDLDQDTRDGVLGWIDASHVERYRDMVEATDGEGPTDDDATRHKSIWQRDKYSYIARHLTGEHLTRYDALRAEHGDAHHPDFVTWTGTWSGTTSPVEQDDIGIWPMARIVDYLATWQPPGIVTWPPGPTIEGLGDTIEAITTLRASEFSQHATELVDVDPTYVRAVFDGFEAALKEGAELSWGPILALADSVAGRPFEPDVEAVDRHRDPGYRWVRRHLSSIIQTGLRDIPNGLGWDYRNQVWAVIERLTEDPNPTPAHEDRYGGDNMEPLTLSLNTNRASALHTVVQYGLWCRRHLTAQGINDPTGSVHFPEILPVLDSHLDPEADPSIAVRAVYGRWYAWLILLDKSWATDRAEAIFGPVDDANDLGDIAWNVYVVWTPPYDSVFRALRPWYGREIGRLPHETTPMTDQMRSPQQKLGEHLATFGWRGGDDSGLADRYFDIASDSLAGGVTESIGQTLANTKELSPAIGARLQAHWDRRVDTLRANPDDHRIELRAFSSWFSSGKLDDVWLLRRFEETIRLAGAPRNAHRAIERLAEDHIDPVTAIRLLSLIVQGANDPWKHLMWRDAARSIVSHAADRPEATDDIRTVIDYFVQTGDLSFRELVTRAGLQSDE